MSVTRLKRPPNASLEHIATMIEELHECLDTHVNDTRVGFQDITQMVHGVDVRLGRVEGTQTAFSQVIGIHPPATPEAAPQATPFGFWSKPKALWAIAVTVTGGAAAYQLIWAMIKAAHTYLVSMPL